MNLNINAIFRQNHGPMLVKAPWLRVLSCFRSFSPLLMPSGQRLFQRSSPRQLHLRFCITAPIRSDPSAPSSELNSASNRRQMALTKQPIEGLNYGN